VRETAVRQRCVDDVPVVETAMRVPGGDAHCRVYGVGEAGDEAGVLVLEMENASPAPFVAAFALRGLRAVAMHATVVVADDRPALLFPRQPSRWATGGRARMEMTVVTGNASTGELTRRRDRAGRLEAAFLHPVAHRATLRAAVVLGTADPGEIDLDALPSAAEATRGWLAQLRRGMQVELPDEGLSAAVRAARAAVLLEGSSSRRPRPELLAALEDWGFDDEAAYVWQRLPTRARRAAQRRATAPAPIDGLDHADPAAFLAALRAGLVCEAGDGSLTLLGGFPREWAGRPLEVHGAPTRAGAVSFALRWHGERPALLWDAPSGVALHAPVLDPGWTGATGTGEALLGGTAR
jgi:hypothetical protein